MRNVIMVGLAALFLASCAARADEDAVAKAGAQTGDEAMTPKPRVFHSQGSVSANGRTIRYKATAGETFIRDDKGEPTASIFSTTYIADGYADPKTRPVAFIFNGGPGSASLWLHMGVFGPKRVRLPADPDHGGPEDDGAAPFDIIANPHSIIDVADLVFIDPVGTGWSRTLGEGKTEDFWGVSEDAQSIREFIRLWLVEHKRWNSPKYLMGESYGTTRSAAVIDALERGWTDIAMNGLVLISSVLNFSLDATDPGNDVAYVGLFPSYAATAWHHGKIDKAQWNGDLEAFLAAARAFALDKYMPALMKGQLLPADERKAIIAETAAFTGLKPAYVDQSDMRVTLAQFMRELMRDEGLTVGRLDSRFTGREPSTIGVEPDADPSAYGIDGAYTAAMLDYFGRDLKVDITDRYVTLGGVQSWNWGTNDAGGDNSYVNVAPYVERAMRQNRDLRVFSANGYYDMATPFFGTELTLAQPAFDRSRLTIEYYEAGHMMYIHQASLEKLAADIRAFVAAKN